jgi:hypothetical protein
MTPLHEFKKIDRFALLKKIVTRRQTEQLKLGIATAIWLVLNEYNCMI